MYLFTQYISKIATPAPLGGGESSSCKNNLQVLLYFTSEYIVKTVFKNYLHFLLFLLCDCDSHKTWLMFSFSIFLPILVDTDNFTFQYTWSSRTKIIQTGILRRVTPHITSSISPSTLSRLLFALVMGYPSFDCFFNASRLPVASQLSTILCSWPVVPL